MDIAYFGPLGRAWDRMTEALFRPFDLKKWLIVGFTAFLAGLTDGFNGGSGGSSDGGSCKGKDICCRDIYEFPRIAWEWLMGHPGWLMLIAVIIVFAVVIWVILTWLSSRGMFMFLDNVVHNRAQIKKPWKQYRREGDSLFLWRMCFTVICVMLIIVLLVFTFVQSYHLYRDSSPQRIPVLFLIEMGLLFIFLLIAMGFVSLFLKHFIVPIMYKHKITATQAWGRFLELFDHHAFHFILFGLFLCVLGVLTFLGVVLAGLMTCCVGFLVLIIPYIGTVVTLPIWYTFRAFSLEYLAQFGPEFDLFHASDE